MVSEITNRNRVGNLLGNDEIFIHTYSNYMTETDLTRGVRKETCQFRCR